MSGEALSKIEAEVSKRRGGQSVPPNPVASPAQILNLEMPMTDPVLWCMHAIGPDEVHAAPSFEEADQAARWCNWRFNQDRVADDVPMRFVVAVWPHSEASHAESVKRWNSEWHPRGPADAPGATVGFGPLTPD